VSRLMRRATPTPSALDGWSPPLRC
jgi:hypothetical protein